jgi:YVTN family beta-propeller protein
MAVVGILASIVITAISPAKHLLAVRDAWRMSMVNEIQKAIVQYAAIRGVYPSDILAGTCQKRAICRYGMSNQANCANLDAIIDAHIMVDLPVDVSEGSGALTGFSAYMTPNGRAEVEASYLGLIGNNQGEGRESTASSITGCPCYLCGCLEDGTYPMSSSDGPIFAINYSTTLYTLDSASRTVTVVDQVTDQIVTTVPVGANPTSMVVVNGSLYVLNRDANSITIINLETNAVTSTVTSIGNSPNYMTVVGTNIYISSFAGASVLVFDTLTNTITATIAGFSNPGASILVGTSLYVWSPTSNSVKVVNTTNNTITATIGGLQQGGSFVLNGTYLYAMSGGTYVYKINTLNNTIAATLTTVGSNPVFGVVVGSKLYTVAIVFRSLIQIQMQFQRLSLVGHPFMQQ